MHSNLRLLLLVLCFFPLGCDKINPFSETDNGLAYLDVKLPKEPVPLNSLPISVLEREAEGFFDGVPLPPIVKAPHDTDKEEYGIRYIQNNHDIMKYVQPGDVFVNFHWVEKSEQNLMRVLQKGQTHAGIVIENKTGGRDLYFPQENGEKFICHLDTSSGWDPSGCLFSDETHFFRIEGEATDKDVLYFAEKVFENWKYDPGFNLDIGSDSQVSKLTADIEAGKASNLYCSELPYTLHSVANQQLLYEPETFGEILSRFNEFRSSYDDLYSASFNDDASVTGIIKYFVGFLPENTNTLLDNSLVRKFVSTAIKNPNGMTARLSGVAGKKLASMWGFLDQSSIDGSGVHYIGSYVPIYRNISMPTDFKDQLEKINQKLPAYTKVLADFMKDHEEVKDIVVPEKKGFGRKVSRVFRWVSAKREGADTDFKNQPPKKGENKLPVILDWLKQEQKYLKSLGKMADEREEIEYALYVEICEQLTGYAGDLGWLGYTLNDMLKADILTGQIYDDALALKRSARGNSARLTLSLEKFGCDTITHTAEEPEPEVDSERVEELIEEPEQ
ncbi:MAG: hypothetical protein CMP10_21575 [Zetaproteobacteria bacterium]|nr:hypothetical protein [Pseudobdellovibrionaceae bacterium]